MNKKQPVRISSSSVYHLDDLIRFGGLFPPIYVNADVRRTRLLGATYAPREGGCMMVRARDDIYQNDVDVQE